MKSGDVIEFICKCGICFFAYYDKSIETTLHICEKFNYPITLTAQCPECFCVVKKRIGGKEDAR